MTKEKIVVVDINCLMTEIKWIRSQSNNDV